MVPDPMSSESRKAACGLEAQIMRVGTVARIVANYIVYEFQAPTCARGGMCPQWYFSYMLLSRTPI